MNVIKIGMVVGGLTLAAKVARQARHSEQGMTDVVRLAGRPIVAWAAHRALVGRNRVTDDAAGGRFTRAEVDRLLGGAWRHYDSDVSALAPQPTDGSRLNVRLAALTHGFLQSLIAAGVERAYAIELVADATWKVYEVWGRIGGAVARLGPDDRRTLVFGRTQPDGAFALTFPFDPPGYVTRLVPADQGVAFDVLRCPVAEYFRARGEADLCRAAWCNLDFPLSEMRGETLRRTQTLVEGADFCDFRVQERKVHPSTTSI